MSVPVCTDLCVCVCVCVCVCSLESMHTPKFAKHNNYSTIEAEWKYQSKNYQDDWYNLFAGHSQLNTE